MSNTHRLSARDIEIAYQQELIAEFEALRAAVEAERVKEEARYARLLLEAQLREALQAALRLAALLPAGTVIDLAPRGLQSILDWEGLHRTKH